MVAPPVVGGDSSFSFDPDDGDENTIIPLLAVSPSSLDSSSTIRENKSEHGGDLSKTTAIHLNNDLPHPPMNNTACSSFQLFLLTLMVLQNSVTVLVTRASQHKPGGAEYRE